MGLKKLLTTEMPTISKSTPYWRALKVCSLLFLLPEIVLIFALLFKQVTLTEFWQISLFLLVLWPMMPLILRMKNDKTFLIITGSVLIVIVALLTAMKICDQYYVKSVFEAYLQGEDYQRKSDSLSKFASSNAIAYAQFLIDESDFLRQSDMSRQHFQGRCAGERSLQMRSVDLSSSRHALSWTSCREKSKVMETVKEMPW